MGNQRQRLARKRFLAANGETAPDITGVKRFAGDASADASVSMVHKRARVDEDPTDVDDGGADVSPELDEDGEPEASGEAEQGEGAEEDEEEKKGEGGAVDKKKDRKKAKMDRLKKKEKIKKEAEKKEKAKKSQAASGAKHPLRVPGKRPGEACFICKEEGHLAKDCPMKHERDRKKMCLSCRQWGHTLQTCPNNDGDATGGGDAKFCYNCGNKGHRLSACPMPIVNGGTAHAACFVCKGKGHLSRDCPSNTHGIYPKGGSCKVCGGVTHLARDCPNRGTFARAGTDGRPARIKITSMEAAPAAEAGRGGKRIVFASGDDLEDDFGNAALWGDGAAA